MLRYANKIAEHQTGTNPFYGLSEFVVSYSPGNYLARLRFSLIHECPEKIYGYRENKRAILFRGYLGQCLQVAKL